MSRLYLILFFIGLSGMSFSQNNLKKYLSFAKEQFDKGDYYYALEYYEKALELDSQTIDILWNYAETLRAYKDYRKAELYYAKIYDRESAQIYPYSLLYLGLMQKHNGKYDEALETFKKAKKKYYKDKKGYLYQKSKQELESVIWAKSSIVDSAHVSVRLLPETVNTKNSEFGHIIHDNKLIFSSLRADSISEIEEVYTTEYHTNLYQSEIKEFEFEQSEKLNALLFESLNTGNGVFSTDGNRFYFSRCNNDGYNYKCKIMVARYSNGTWSAVDSLGDIINEPGANTTMPCIAFIDGEEILFFASDRSETEGGLDLFYSKITNGNQYGKVKPLKAVNSLDNEVTPFWDDANKRLYFSSSWHNGFGGNDIHYTLYDGKFNSPVNAGRPFNSSANDIYFFKNKDTAYVSSNRIGVMYSKNPTCCSDIFEFKPPVIIIPPTPIETLFELNKRLPVTLYFHNDIPNPDSWSTTTDVNYIKAYDDYTAMIGTYQTEYAKGLKNEKAEEAKEDIESFFAEYVDKGVRDLKLFQDLLLQELDKGAKIEVTVKGFASPLAKTNYNVNLTKRRIASLVNYLRAYNNGVFAKYLDNNAPNGGHVIFSEVPFGEYTANQLTSDNPNDVQNSVYSRAAAIERKIEIQSVSYMEEESESALVTDNPVSDKGITTQGEKLEATFTIKNRSDKPIQLDPLRIPCDCVKANVDKSKLAPGESTQVHMEYDTKSVSGFAVQSVYVKMANSDQELRLYITTEVK